ncbi:MAG: hypothetical protein R3C58_00020 [Parvularculaceae bacterium]
MCGIAGIVDLEGERPVDRGALIAMTRALAHRGPDSEGFHIAPGAGFGHRRLAIIDREGGAQPFHAQTRGGVLTYNGEIYNHAKPQNCGKRSLKTCSDAEVLAEGFAMRGVSSRTIRAACSPSASGSRMRAAWTLARDRLGERPL